MLPIPDLPNLNKVQDLAEYSELGQEKFVLGMTDVLRGGFFVEIGLMNGREYSNTYLLEKEFSWQGIVVEPNTRYHADIACNRQCRVDHRAVTGCSGNMARFKDISVQPGLSGLVQHFQPDDHRLTRDQDIGNEFMVETVSMHDMLLQHDAPRHIDYVSIDVEGAEIEILSNFDWTQWNIDIMTVEHNFVHATLHGVREIMASQGYSWVEWAQPNVYEDWFFQPHLLKGTKQ